MSKNSGRGNLFIKCNVLISLDKMFLTLSGDQNFIRKPLKWPRSARNRTRDGKHWEVTSHFLANKVVKRLHLNSGK